MVRLTWRELADQTEALALGLLGIGIENGDRVGIWAPTCVEWTVLQFAAARVGAILVNVNPAYRPAELLRRARQSGVPDCTPVQDVGLSGHGRRR
jgi:fatty-acyl-CoA synthase